MLQYVRVPLQPSLFKARTTLLWELSHTPHYLDNLNRLSLSLSCLVLMAMAKLLCILLLALLGISMVATQVSSHSTQYKLWKCAMILVLKWENFIIYTSHNLVVIVYPFYFSCIGHGKRSSVPPSKCKFFHLFCIIIHLGNFCNFFCKWWFYFTLYHSFDKIFVFFRGKMDKGVLRVTVSNHRQNVLFLPLYMVFFYHCEV